MSTRYLVWLGVTVVLAAIVYLGGCATPKSMSWDQENLKRNDSGCPTAIYVAPAGILVQCQTAAPQAVPPEITKFLALIGVVPDTTVYTKYDTAEEAATVALRNIADKFGGIYEYGGVIGKTKDGKFEISEPNTSYAGDHVRINGDLPSGTEPYGNYHTHPCLPFHDVEYFSPEDLFEPLFVRMPAVFMGDFCTGHVHEFKYGDKPDVEHPQRPDGSPIDNEIWLTKGRIVGQFTKPVTK